MLPIRKVGLIVGHSKRSPGAIVKVPGYPNTTEYEYNQIVAQYLLDNHVVKYVEYRDNGGIIGATQRMVAHGVDLSVELHCNSHDKPAYGVEALYITTQSFYAADFFCRKFATYFKRKNRGAKKISQANRGYQNLNLMRKVPYAILVEPFFGSNPEEFIPQIVYAKFLDNFIKDISESSKALAKMAAENE